MSAMVLQITQQNLAWWMSMREKSSQHLLVKEAFSTSVLSVQSKFCTKLVNSPLKLELE